MIIWSGDGISVAMITFIGVVVGFWIATPIADATGLAFDAKAAVAVGIGGVLSAIGIHFRTRSWDREKPVQMLIDQATGERVEIKRGPGTLFFVPMRYWTWIVPALAAFVAYVLWDSLR